MHGNKQHKIREYTKQKPKLQNKKINIKRKIKKEKQLITTQQTAKDTKQIAIRQ